MGPQISRMEFHNAAPMRLGLCSRAHGNCRSSSQVSALSLARIVGLATHIVAVYNSTLACTLRIYEQTRPLSREIHSTTHHDRALTLVA